jgi:hypothetical protein
MEKHNKWNCPTYLGASRLLGVSIWRLRYAIDSHYLPPPSVVLKRRALFSPDQVKEMRQYFEKDEEHRRRQDRERRDQQVREE